MQTTCLRLGEPEQHACAVGCCPRQLHHPLVVRRDRNILLEVPNCVATERQLREHRQVGSCADSLGDRLLGTCDVGLDLAGSGVDLRERNAHFYLPQAGDEGATRAQRIEPLSPTAARPREG
jgi:hypothetical protein